MASSRIEAAVTSLALVCDSPNKGCGWLCPFLSCFSDSYAFALEKVGYTPNTAILGPLMIHLNVEIKMELKGMGPQRDGIDLFFPLVGEPGFDDVLGKHITAEQERMIGFERIERLL
jgi:hypothetical protein